MYVVLRDMDGSCVHSETGRGRERVREILERDRVRETVRQTGVKEKQRENWIGNNKTIKLPN